MAASVTFFPRRVPEEERTLMTRPPDPDALQIAENLLIAALWNYRQVATGASEEIGSYLDVPPIWRESFYRNYAVPAAVNAIWHDGEDK
jgi:hypothetical protein